MTGPIRLLCVALLVVASAMPMRAEEIAPSAPDPDETIAFGWRHYQVKQYAEAAGIFERAVALWPDRLDASMALGYSYANLGRADEAIAIFTRLLEQGYEPGKMLEALLGQLVAHGEAGPLARAMREHGSGADACSRPGVMAGGAARLLSLGQSAEARRIYEDLLAHCRLPLDLRMGSLYGLKALVPRERMLEVAAREMVKSPLPEIAGFRLNVIREAMADESLSTADRLRYADLALDLAPDDTSTRAGAAWAAFDAGMFDLSRKHFERLIELEPDRADHALGLLYTYTRLGLGAEALALAERYKDASKEFSRARADLLMSAGVAAYDAGRFDEAARIYRGLLDESPADAAAREMLVWSLQNAGRPDEAAAFVEGMEEPPEAMAALRTGHLLTRAHAEYEAGRYAEAADGFRAVLAIDPDNTEATEMLGWSLERAGQTDETIALVESMENPPEAMVALRADHLLNKARSDYEAGKYSEAADGFRAVLAASPENAEARELLAWSLLKAGRDAEAIDALMDLYEAREGADVLLALLAVLARAEGEGTAYAAARELALSPEPEVRTVAADHMASRGWRLSAAQAGALEECAPWLTHPWVRVGLSVHTKSGDPGFSEIVELRAGVEVRTPVGIGSELVLRVASHSLDAGSPSSSTPYAGRPFLLVLQRGLATSVTAVEPTLHFRSEGPVTVEAEAGPGPMGGLIAPTGAFALKVSTGGLSLRAYREPVRQSVLSYTGLKDPYATAEPLAWGGVSRLGAGAEYAIPLPSGWGASVGGRYEAYSGADVIDNAAHAFTLSAGRSIGLEDATLYVGAFGEYMAFDENTDFFTHGHGGYFSPQDFLAAGPVARYTTPECRTWRLDVQGSVQYLAHSTDSTMRYPLDPSRTEVYPGEDKTGVGLGARVEWAWEFTRGWELGAVAAGGRSSDYESAEVGLSLRHSLGR